MPDTYIKITMPEELKSRISGCADAALMSDVSWCRTKLVEAVRQEEIILHKERSAREIQERRRAREEQALLDKQERDERRRAREARMELDRKSLDHKRAVKAAQQLVKDTETITRMSNMGLLSMGFPVLALVQGDKTISVPMHVVGKSIGDPVHPDDRKKFYPGMEHIELSENEEFYIQWIDKFPWCPIPYMNGNYPVCDVWDDRLDGLVCVAGVWRLDPSEWARDKSLADRICCAIAPGFIVTEIPHNEYREVPNIILKVFLDSIERMWLPSHSIWAPTMGLRGEDLTREYIRRDIMGQYDDVQGKISYEQWLKEPMYTGWGDIPAHPLAGHSR